MTLTTEFDLYENPLSNRGWCLLDYPQRYADYGLDADKRLVAFLSQRLNTPVVTYARDDTGCFVGTTIWMNGENKDLFETYDLDIVEASGYFEKYKNQKAKDYDEIFAITNPYFDRMGLNLREEAIPWGYEDSRHPMYLKGSPVEIVKFLKEEKANRV